MANQPKSFIAANGKRCKLNPLVPAGEIRWLVNRKHVSASDDDIRALIMERSDNWPEHLREQAAEYAVSIHHANRALYRRATAG